MAPAQRVDSEQVDSAEVDGLSVLRLGSVYEPDEDSFDTVDQDSAHFDPIGGMQNQVASLSRALDALGVRQLILTSRLAGPTGDTPLGRHGLVRRIGVRMQRLRQLWALAALPSVLRPGRRVDLVHAHQGEDIATLLLALVARARHRRPLVVTLHCSVGHTAIGTDARAFLLRHVGGPVERFALRRADAVICLVPRTARLIRDDGVPGDRIHVLPSGYEPAVFAPVVGDAFPGVPRPRVGYVGRLAESKRAHLLVEAFGLLEHDAQLVIVGDGPARGLVEDAVDRSPARSRITRRGFVPHAQVPAILASLDLLVLPSAYEEMGSVLVEAMVSGLPVVATDVGGIPEVVEAGATGLLVPADDVPALARALDDLLSDQPTRARMRAHARRRARDYAWPGIAARTAAVYRDLTRAVRNGRRVARRRPGRRAAR